METRNGTRSVLAILAAVGLLGCGLVQAQTSDPKAKAALGRLQQQNLQLANQKTRLEQENSTLSKQATEASTALAGKTASLARANSELRKKAEVEASLNARVAELEAQLAEAQRKEAETAETLRGREAVLAEQSQVLARQARLLQSHEDRIVDLHALGNELLDHYRNKSCLDSWLEADRVTGLGRVSAENKLQAYRERLDAHKSGAVVRR